MRQSKSEGSDVMQLFPTSPSDTFCALGLPSVSWRITGCLQHTACPVEDDRNVALVERKSFKDSRRKPAFSLGGTADTSAKWQMGWWNRSSGFLKLFCDLGNQRTALIVNLTAKQEGKVRSETCLKSWGLPWICWLWTEGSKKHLGCWSPA